MFCGMKKGFLLGTNTKTANMLKSPAEIQTEPSPKKVTKSGPETLSDKELDTKKDKEIPYICPKTGKMEESRNDVRNQYNVKPLGNKDELIVNHEIQLFESSEANPQTYITGCTKNPGHKEFIPVGTFSLDHLPEGHRDIDLYEYIKAIADLTVKVDVRMTSPGRPKVWPKTNAPYPLYNIKKSTNLRTGSGRIDEVEKFTNGVNKRGDENLGNFRNCWCKNCESSDTPSNVWWEFVVTTATHVVFDDIEASHTSLILFYDSDDSPVVKVDKVRVRNVDIEHDVCNLICVTCDKNLGNKLVEMWEHYSNVRMIDNNKYKKCRDEVKLTFIVSHPHGCFKQVSVGQWKDKHKGINNEYKFTYTTCTCPGSSGASVHCVGYQTGWWSNDFVHRGSLNSELNQSGVCLVLNY